MIRVQQLVLLLVSGIGWHHCRTWNSIIPHDWSTVMWPVFIGCWHRVSTAINSYQGRTRDPIGPCNWSIVMWLAPIGWWRRVSLAIYTTRTQDLGSVLCGWFFVDSSWLVSPRSCTHSCTGSTVHFRQQPLLRGTSSSASAPLYIPFRVLPWSQPNLAQRSGVPGDVRHSRTVYREPVINVLVEKEQKLCLCCSWTGTSNTLVSWRTLGRCPSFHGGPLGEFGKKLKHTQREGFYCPGLGVGSRSRRRDRAGFWCRDQDQWRS